MPCLGWGRKALTDLSSQTGVARVYSILLHFTTVQYSAMQCSAAPCSAVQGSAAQYSAIQQFVRRVQWQGELPILRPECLGDSKGRSGARPAGERFGKEIFIITYFEETNNLQ